MANNAISYFEKQLVLCFKLLKLKFNHLPGCWKYANVGDFQLLRGCISESAGNWVFTFIKRHIGFKHEVFYDGKLRVDTSLCRKKEHRDMIGRSEGKRVKR